jgi:hypothetical protein
MRNGGASAANAILFTIDTSGYQSVGLQIFGTWAGTITFQASNDGASWVAVAGWNTATGTAAVSSTTVNGMWSLPCVGKYFRAIITAYTSGMAQATAYLRAQPVAATPATPTVQFTAASAGVNMAQVGGTAVPSAGLAGVAPVAGGAAVGSVPATYPVLVGAVDSTGKIRRFLADASGQLVVQGTVPAAIGVQNVPVLATQDQTQTEGQSRDELLLQMLIELRVLNLKFHELPRILNTGSGLSWDEPGTLRTIPTDLN